MNIPAINFGAKQRFEYTKPRVSQNSSTSTPIALDAAIEQYQNKTLFSSMVHEAKQALAVVPTIQNASQYALKKASDITYDSIQIQQEAQKVLAEIIDTCAFSRYCRDERKERTFDSYVTKIKLNDDVYKVTITPEKITAVQKVNNSPYVTTSKTGKFYCGPIDANGKTIYEFDTKERELIYCAQGVKRQGYLTSIDDEFFFKDGFLSKFNSGVSKGEFDFINQSYSFGINRFDEHVLKSFSSKVIKTLNEEKIERFFEFSPYRELVGYSRNLTKDKSDKTTKELEYIFEDGALKTFRKDFVSSPNYWGSKLFAQFTSENNFYVESRCDSNKIPEYSAICFYQNGEIEGSVI